MYRTETVKAEMARQGLTITSASKAMGMSFPTFSKKLKDGSWTIKEADKLGDLLGVVNKGNLFFEA